jgi:hypothetical protein
MHKFKIFIVILSVNIALAHCDCSAHGGICSAGFPNVQECCCDDVQTDPNGSGDQTCASGTVCGFTGSVCSTPSGSQSGPEPAPTPEPAPVSPSPSANPPPTTVPAASPSSAHARACPNVIYGICFIAWLAF